MKAWPSAIGLAVVLAAGLVIRADAQGQPTPASATIILQAAGGGCDKTLLGNDPDLANYKARMRANRGVRVQWTIVNLSCAGTVNVKIDFGTNSPFTPGGPADNCSAAPGGGTCRITSSPVRMNATGNTSSTTYPYSVFVGGVKKDPDLVIDP